MISTTLRDASNNGYNWTAVYDGLGRRLRTTHAATGTAGVNSQVTGSFFDPQVEFQEVGVSLNGAHTWKIFGPDLDGSYGGSQGLGGLEATVWQPAQQITPAIQDYFGNIPVTSSFNWSPTRVNSYGPVLGYSSPVFSSGISLAEASVWRGKRIEPTGFYWLGARYYDPVAGRFLSPDPLGHDASMDLYSFCGGDPVNRFDSDGRFGKGLLNGLGSGLNEAYNLVVKPPAYGLGDFMDKFNQIGGRNTGPSYHSMLNGSLLSDLLYGVGYGAGELTFQSALFVATGGIGSIAEAAAARSAFGIGMESFAARSLVSLESRATVQGLVSAELRGSASLAIGAEATGLRASAESSLYVMGEGGQMEFGFAQNLAQTPARTAMQPIPLATETTIADNSQLELNLANRTLPTGNGGTGAGYDKLRGQGLYVLRDETGAIKYVGRGDAPARIATHALTPGKDDLIGEILWDNNLTKAQAKGLEQRVIDQFGGAASQNPNTPLLNRIRSYAPRNPNAATYRGAVSDELWAETLLRLGL